MQTSVIGERPHRFASAGFTLVELLVTLAIVGLISGVVIVALPSRDTSLQRAAQIFAARLKIATEEATIVGIPYGVSISQSGAQFFRYRDRAWRQIGDDKLLGPIAWDDGVSVHVLQSGGEKLDTSNSDDSNDPAGPMFMFDPVGLATPFTVTLSRGAVTYQIAASQTADIVTTRHADGTP